jgi:hypothetical protein
MGGHACVVYGAAESSRDLGLLILCDPANLACFKGARDELSAWRRLPDSGGAAARSTERRSGVELLSLEDLVSAKKTQPDKDWPMIRRLVEVSWHSRAEPPSQAQN